jgi:hypothetical protein
MKLKKLDEWLDKKFTVEEIILGMLFFLFACWLLGVIYLIFLI